jgi:hypothetical protein
VNKILKWLRLRFHICSGTVVYKYDASYSYPGKGCGTGLVSICTCDVCGKPFATLETITGVKIKVSPAIAVRRALVGPVDSFHGHEYRALQNLLLNLQKKWDL